MARKLRVQYPGAVYHVMSRGDHQEDIFRSVADRELFLKTLGEACAKATFQIHAYCLMRNHLHLVVETPEGNLAPGMKWLLGTYTARFNRRHKLFGHLFTGRYKALIIDGNNRGYLRTACDYVHLNPIRAKLVKSGQPLETYAWSSYPHYLAPAERPPWLRVDRLLGECGIPKDSRAGRRQFGVRTEERRRMDNEEEFKAMQRGWYLGDEEFRQELLAQMEEWRGPWHYGQELGESSEAKAQRLVKELLKKHGWKEADVGKRRKGDPVKVKMAQRLRAETVMTLEWIAHRLQMGARTYVAHLLYWSKRDETERPTNVNTTILLTDPFTAVAIYCME